MIKKHKVKYINDISLGRNIYIKDGTLYSCVNTEVEKDLREANITLLNYYDYIIDEFGYKVYGHPEKWILDKKQNYLFNAISSDAWIYSGPLK